MSTTTTEQLLDIADSAERLGVGERFVRRVVNERRIPFFKIGRHIRFDPDDVEDWIARSRIEPSSGSPVASWPGRGGSRRGWSCRQGDHVRDDSSGAIGDVARRLLEIHEHLGDAGVADPKALAKWMIRFSFDDQEFFNPDPVRYADALGESGLAVLRREVGERMAAPDPDFAVRHVQERLAVLDGDVDRVVELLGGDLDRPHDFIRVAEAMLELDRSDDALAWARRGIDSVTGWQVGQPYDIAAGVLADRGDDAGVLDLRREQHQRRPSSTTYAKLKSAASPGAWADEQAAAREVLGARDLGGLVDALLADGDVDAWTAATDANPETIGDQRWARLAEEREATHPAAALNVYLRLVDSTLQQADRRNYRAAAKQLERAQKAAAAADLSDEFDEHLAALREQHRRWPTLIGILDKAGMR